MNTIIPRSTQVMSVPEAAAHLGVSTSKMYEIVRICKQKMEQNNPGAAKMARFSCAHMRDLAKSVF